MINRLTLLRIVVCSLTSRHLTYLRLLILASVLGGLLPITASAAQHISLRDDTLQFQVWSSLTELSDPTKKMSIHEVLAVKDHFSPPQKAHGTLGLRKDAVWLHIPVTVSDQSNGLWLLDIDYPVINRIDLYITSGNKLLQQSTLGNLQPAKQRVIDGRAHTFPLKLKAGESYDLFLRIENTGAMILPITLNKPSAFHVLALREQMLQGLLTGLALCLLAYSLAQWLSLGEHLFIKYALLISGSTMFSLLQFGIGAQYIWSGNFWLETHMGGLSALIAITGTFLFIEQALEGPDLPVWLAGLMKLGAALSALFAVSYCFDLISIHTVTFIVGTLGLMPTVLGTPGAFKRARRGDSIGVYFLLAWTVYFIATAVMIEVIKGRLPVNFWTMHSFQFGATFDMLIFMKVLGTRTKSIHAAMLHATGERDKLHSLAHSDPLTGLPNRREIHSCITAAIAQGTSEKIVAVYMLDLDGFKQVNDQYGHDVGDELLISVAQRLQASLRSTDVVARLGGDEFVVMASELKTHRQAEELAEKMLSAFNYAFVLSEQSCRVGLTIGYALAPLDGNNTQDLLKRADAAMYSGKQDGKHCARRADATEIQASLIIPQVEERRSNSAAA
jgi:diguanylate cyclase (GGDEF)-like protein